jgi:hypothetical protein
MGSGWPGLGRAGLADRPRASMTPPAACLPHDSFTALLKRNSNETLRYDSSHQ